MIILKINKLNAVAQRRTIFLSWTGLAAMGVQFGVLARLTWWDYSWDIIEPVTYLVTFGTTMAMFAYFVLTKQVHVNYEQYLHLWFYFLSCVKILKYVLVRLIHSSLQPLYKFSVYYSAFSVSHRNVDGYDCILFVTSYPLKCFNANCQIVKYL